MADVNDLERRVTIIEDTEAIKRLKYRYWRYLDLKEWDELTMLFAPDASVNYGTGKYEFKGVEAIIRFFRESLGRETGAVTIHQGHHPEIDFSSATTATGTWALYNYMYNVQQNRGIRIGAFYHDRYVKQDADWKFQTIGYTHIFHEEMEARRHPELATGWRVRESQPGST